MIILVCIINAGRALGEPDDEPPAADQGTKLDGVSHCVPSENFLDQEPCWADYQPTLQVDKMRDIYRHSEKQGASLVSEKLTINGTEFNNPMYELM